MVSPYDIDSMFAIANGRRERFLDEARQARIVRELGASRQRMPSRFRRAVGMGLIQAGSRLSGITADMRRSDSVA